MNGICKLCGDAGKLCDSHIIPELCYRATYDSLHRSTKYQADPNSKRLLQMGIREYLLCRSCEAQLNKFETGFKKYWYDRQALPQHVNTPVIEVSGFDYKTFKLFHLSILWRASVATIDAFNTVSLGRYEGKLRQILLAGNPGPEDHYPMYAQVLLKGQTGQVAYGLVGKPQQSQFDRATVYYTAYAGCEWVVMVTENPTSKERGLLPLAPTQAGKMLLAAIPFQMSNTFKIFAEQYGGGNPRQKSPLPADHTGPGKPA